MDDIRNICDLYEKSTKYLEEESKNDPETEPFRSKYKAMIYLKSINEQINSLLENNTEHSALLKRMLAVILVQMGVIYVDTEELASGELHLNEAISCIEDRPNHENILVSLTARNQLGILWCGRGDHERAKKYLEESEELYNEFHELNENVYAVMSFHEHFDNAKETRGSIGSQMLEKVYTLTKFYLAQVYGKLGEPMKSALYCHETLRRQLESKQYDSVDWALNSATLSQYFMEKLLFPQARHHLAASTYILDSYENQLKTLEIGEEEMEAKTEELRHRRADVSRCWAKLGIFILEQSKDENSSTESDAPDILKKCWFSTLELGEYESQMDSELVNDFGSARELMLVTQRHLQAAKEFYTLENHASDFVQIVQDHSTLIRHLTWFEKDEGRLCKMHKKRINMLEELIKELNPQYCMHACRAMWFELGEAYHDIMHIKHLKIRESGEHPNPSALAKANALAESSIRNFNAFLDSLRNKDTKVLPEQIPDDLLRPTLVAHFYLGRLYYKLVSPDKRQMLQNTYEAFSCFKYMVDYCNSHPKGSAAVSEELEVAEEMMSLLQLKIKQSVNLIS